MTALSYLEGSGGTTVCSTSTAYTLLLHNLHLATISHYATLQVPRYEAEVMPSYEESHAAGGEDDAAQLLSNEHVLACNSMGMVPEHGTPLAQQNINVGRPPSTGTYSQVSILPPLS